MARVELKLEQPRHTRCFFDPYKSCGSHSRSKFAYQRHELIKEAKKCGIPYASQLSLDALCMLMKEIYFEDLKKLNFLKQFDVFDVYNPDSFLVVPTTLGGSLTIKNAQFLLDNKDTLEHVRSTVRKNQTEFDAKKLYFFTSIFFDSPTPKPSNVEDQEDEILKNFVLKLNK